MYIEEEGRSGDPCEHKLIAATGLKRDLARSGASLL